MQSLVHEWRSLKGSNAAQVAKHQDSPRIDDDVIDVEGSDLLGPDLISLGLPLPGHVV